MTRRQKEPLRPLTTDEQQWLERISRSQSDPVSQVSRQNRLSWGYWREFHRRSPRGRTTLE